MRGAADNGAQVQTVLEVAQPRGVDVHDGNVVGFGYQVFGNRRADLAGTEYHDFQGGVSLLFARRECRELSTCGTSECARDRCARRRALWTRLPARDDARSKSARMPSGPHAGE